MAGCRVLSGSRIYYNAYKLRQTVLEVAFVSYYKRFWVIVVYGFGL
jgi:hypothetical protein